MITRYMNLVDHFTDEQLNYVTHLGDELNADIELVDELWSRVPMPDYNVTVYMNRERLFYFGVSNNDFDKLCIAIRELHAKLKAYMADARKNEN